MSHITVNVYLTVICDILDMWHTVTCETPGMWYTVTRDLPAMCHTVTSGIPTVWNNVTCNIPDKGHTVTCDIPDKTCLSVISRQIPLRDSHDNEHLVWRPAWILHTFTFVYILYVIKIQNQSSALRRPARYSASRDFSMQSQRHCQYWLFPTILYTRITLLKDY